MSKITYERSTNPANGQQFTSAGSFEPSAAAVQAVAAARELLASRPDRDLAGWLSRCGRRQHRQHRVRPLRGRGARRSISNGPRQ